MNARNCLSNLADQYVVPQDTKSIPPAENDQKDSLEVLQMCRGLLSIRRDAAEDGDAMTAHAADSMATALLWVLNLSGSLPVQPVFVEVLSRAAIRAR